jgi:hypothetical protein
MHQDKKLHLPAFTPKRLSRLRRLDRYCCSMKNDRVDVVSRWQASEWRHRAGCQTPVHGLLRRRTAFHTSHSVIVGVCVNIIEEWAATWKKSAKV